MSNIATLSSFYIPIMNRLSLLVFVLLFSLISLTAPAQRLASGAYHGLYICNDSTVNAWGSNITGQVGDNTITDRNRPVYVNNLSQVIALSGGGQHCLALKSDGSVWSWGNNASGQLGDGTNTNRHEAAPVPLLEGITAVAAGTNHSMALKSDSTVWRWGSGALPTPAQIPDLTGIVAISTGVAHTLALKNDSTVWAWGNNNAGQLGDGSTDARSTPVQVLGLSSVVAVAVGKFQHSLALKSDGTVWSWGWNESGQLGDSSNVESHVPLQVRNLTNVTAIGAGYMHSLALKADGTLWAWGDNEFGQIGDSTTIDRWEPVQVLDDVKVLAAGAYYHTLVEKNDGTVWSWGHNLRGALGVGGGGPRHYPVEVTNLCIPLDTRIPEMPESRPVTLYPNPVSGVLHIAGIRKNTTCRLYTLSGSLVLAKQLHPATEQEIIPLDVSMLPAGLYMLVTETGSINKVMIAK